MIFFAFQTSKFFKQATISVVFPSLKVSHSLTGCCGFIPAFTLAAIHFCPLPSGQLFLIKRFFLIRFFIYLKYIKLHVSINNSSVLILFMIGKVISEIFAHHTHPSSFTRFRPCFNYSQNLPVL